ncbi:receptor-like protein EIX1 [Quercus lobata]|uniref:Leucine-rich repeat-containing N-terminal plant-type domain-containing protein n=1 Tax=Quercus lobata TaxID=97700 RepID=A0A7N2ML22_QUELO|nr:receptor-like protein EIX1 [Quercus lobata]
MTMIKFLGGGFLKLLHAFLMLLVHLSLVLGFISGARVGDANNIRCLEGERQALLEFKKVLVDDYGKLSSWRSEDEHKNCCNWEGVHCDNQTGHVLELEVHYLRGMISPSILELPYLTSLDLRGHDFNQSHIPEFICSLSNLTFLDLSLANLSGSFPDQLGNLSHLQQLHLNRNDLKVNENLEWLSHLSSLEYLDLSDTNLRAANDWLEVVSHLPNLKSLFLSTCDLPPMSFSSLPSFNYSKSFTSLESLSLSSNQLNGSILKFLGGICSLRQLYLGNTTLKGQLVDLLNNLSGCAKDSLEGLSLPSNQISGLWPNNFGILFPLLKEINLRNNSISGTLPKTIGNLYNLNYLAVTSNCLRGVISEAFFSNLSKLKYLDLSKNSLTLEFSSQWVPTFQLNFIILDSIKLGPRFPNWIQTQTKIIMLDISDAQISDTIPAEWFTDLPPTLAYLNLSCNQIYGWLPNMLTKFENEGLAIDLSANQIRGRLPLFPTKVMMLNLSKNRFSGTISSLCKISSGFLSYLDLSENRLSGQLPNCFMHWRKLVILNLASNNFSGEVPSSFALLTQLETLSLSNNSFYGDLPLPMKNCSSLSFVDLGNNRFFGQVPAWIGESLPLLNILILHSNNLNGSIPLHMCWLKDLHILDLSLNDISGTIPQCLNNFTAMTQIGNSSSDIFHRYYFKFVDTMYTNMTFVYEKEFVDNARLMLKRREYKYDKILGLLKIIDLSSNKLMGKLPDEISSLLQLVGLNVSRNKLVGEIPQTIGQMKQLQSLDLSRNQFSGKIPSSMSELNFLSDIDLSYNNLSGKIPTSTQLQSFKASDFTTRKKT